MLNLSDKIEEVKKSCFSKFYHLLSVEKYEKLILNNRFEISAPTWNDKFDYLKDHILYQLFKVFFEYHKNHDASLTDNQPIRIYIKKIENIIKLLMRETMRLFGNTENKITKDKNDESILHSEINSIVLINYNIVYNNYQQNSGVLCTSVSNNHLVNY